MKNRFTLVCMFVFACSMSVFAQQNVSAGNTKQSAAKPVSNSGATSLSSSANAKSNIQTREQAINSEIEALQNEMVSNKSNKSYDMKAAEIRMEELKKKKEGSLKSSQK